MPDFYGSVPRGDQLFSARLHSFDWVIATPDDKQAALVQAAELGRYGITANAVAPAARTRMTETVFAEMMKKPESGFDAMAPENVAPLVVWLGSSESKEVTGCVFEVSGGAISLADGWREGPKIDKGARWEPDEVGATVRDLLEKAVPAQKVYGT